MLAAFSALHLVVLLIWLALTVAVIWSIVRVARSTRMGVFEKVVWVIILLVVPVIGLAVWLVADGVARRRSASLR